MAIPKKHAPNLFLVVMVSIMVVLMSLVLGLVNDAYAAGFWTVWPRQFAIAYVVAIPASFIARWLAQRAVAKLTA